MAELESKGAAKADGFRDARRCALLILLVALVGCAGAPWRVDYPGFQMRALEWVKVDTRRQLANLCASEHPELMGCAFRIKESGLCLVYSIYSQEQAHYMQTADGHTLFEHEVGTSEVPGHCGGGRRGGYTNH